MMTVVCAVNVTTTCFLLNYEHDFLIFSVRLVFNSGSHWYHCKKWAFFSSTFSTIFIEYLLPGRTLRPGTPSQMYKTDLLFAFIEFNSWEHVICKEKDTCFNSLYLKALWNTGVLFSIPHFQKPHFLLLYALGGCACWMFPSRSHWMYFWINLFSLSYPCLITEPPLGSL